MHVLTYYRISHAYLNILLYITSMSLETPIYLVPCCLFHALFNILPYISCIPQQTPIYNTRLYKLLYISLMPQYTVVYLMHVLTYYRLLHSYLSSLIITNLSLRTAIDLIIATLHRCVSHTSFNILPCISCIPQHTPLYNKPISPNSHISHSCHTTLLGISCTF